MFLAKKITLRTWNKSNSQGAWYKVME